MTKATFLILAALSLTGCCDYKIQYDAARNNYWIYKCGLISRVEDGPFTRYDDAVDKVRSMRKNPTRMIAVPE